MRDSIIIIGAFVALVAVILFGVVTEIARGITWIKWAFG